MGDCSDHINSNVDHGWNYISGGDIKSASAGRSKIIMCKLCLERGKTWIGSDPKCAFENGVFSPDNWNCATMSKLRAISEKLDLTMIHNDVGFGVVPFDGENFHGYIVMTWYKNRGKVSNAQLMNDDNVVELTEEMALEAIEN